MSTLIQPFITAMATGGLVLLPPEVLFTILENDCLNLEDIACLRLTCRPLSESTASILFRRIIISPLRQDRWAFENICRSPHLAQHVREVEWAELAWFPGYFNHFIWANPEGPGFMSSQSDFMLHNTVTLLDEVCAEEFWLPAVIRDRMAARISPLPYNEELFNREEAVEEFIPIFFELLGLLPHLHTMASRPMSSKRMIRSPQYSVRVGHIQAQTPEWPISNWNQSNDGLLLFILPAMAILPIPVRRLAWQDELPGNGAFGALRPDAFTQLDTLSISLSTAFFFFPLPITEKLTRLDTCLDACNNVRHLSLAVESEYASERQINHCIITTSLLRYSPGTRQSNWRRLVSLNLTSMEIEDHVLVAVVSESAETLRHLYLQECNTTLGGLKKLSKIPGLRLRSAQILGEYPKSQCHRIPEQKLLEFLNGQKVPEGEDVQMCTSLDETLEEDASDIQPPDYETCPHRMFDDDCPESFTNILVMTLPAALDGVTSSDDSEFGPTWLNSADIDDSDQSVVERVQNGPKWLWNRCCDNNNTERQIYFTQVPDSHPDGLPTVVWRFTNRHGLSYIGSEPLEGFEDWDPEQGDVEEPLPYSAEMDESIQAANLEAPPPGVVLYDRNDAFRAQLFYYQVSE
ncbi:unnamed protein product [Clonostachys solani]|uniref:F-box domain-containing protein n=1 Tax=Clonostachys solani TaxID=160281 RepID=A0A9N9Z007_9HYPO|nr:unnamed protein product [Clonostachys solani]